MAKSKKKKLKHGADKPAELGLQGQGVEPLVIPAIEKAANKFLKAKADAEPLNEVVDDSYAALLEVVKEHKAELVNEVGGGCSYRYGDVVLFFKPGKEKLSVKNIHDAPAPESGE